MAKRTLYFLRDSLTGLYYTDRSNTLYSWEGDVAKIDPKDSYHTFENAVIHTTESSVKDGQKKRVRVFKSDLNIPVSNLKPGNWQRVKREIAEQRQHLPFFGIEIVKIEVSD